MLIVASEVEGLRWYVGGGSDTWILEGDQLSSGLVRVGPSPISMVSK